MKSLRILKWSGFTLSLLLLVLWYAGGWYGFSAVVVNSRYFVQADVGRGAALVQFGHTSGDLPVSLNARYRAYRFIGDAFAGWYWLPRITPPDAFRSGEPPGAMVVPLWLPLMISVSATMLLHRRERRAARLANLCPNCSYPLSGLPPRSPCPECGRNPE